MRPELPTIWVSPSSCLLHHWQLIKEEVIENPLQETVQNPAKVLSGGGGIQPMALHQRSGYGGEKC